MRFHLVNYLGMRKITVNILVLTVFILSGYLYAQRIPDAPNPPRLVNDFTNTLTQNEISTLEQKLVNYNDTTSTQILVVLVNDIGGTEVSDYTFKLGEKWGVGQKGKNNGAIVLVQPKTNNIRGQAFIATGYGLESVIPDALAKRIVEKEMIPSFQEGNYYAGINKATTAIMDLASGLYQADKYDQGAENAWFIPIIVLIIVIIMIRSSRSSNHIGGRKGNLPFWTALWLASQTGSWWRWSRWKLVKASSIIHLNGQLALV